METTVWKSHFDCWEHGWSTSKRDESFFRGSEFQKISDWVKQVRREFCLRVSGIDRLIRKWTRDTSPRDASREGEVSIGINLYKKYEKLFSKRRRKQTQVWKLRRFENRRRIRSNKRLRARDGCLGTYWLRKTVEATKECGELPTKRWPACIWMRKLNGSKIPLSYGEWSSHRKHTQWIETSQ